MKTWLERFYLAFSYLNSESRLSFYLWTLTFPKVFFARTTLYSCAGGSTVEPYKTGLHGGECGELKQIRDDQGDGDVHWTLSKVHI